MQYLAITKATFNILVTQRGDLFHLRENAEAWISAYHDEIQSTINQIRIAPGHCLDIGSGMGAVDVCMARGYGTHCTLIDGDSTEGLQRHAEPFCNRKAVEEFWSDNEVCPDQWQYLCPGQISDMDPIYDLVLSMRSWCFHYPPETYLAYVQRHTVPWTMIMVDMRKGKKEWRERMRASFEEMAVVEEGEKYERIIYRVRGRTQ